MLRAHKHWLPVVLWMGVIFAMSTGLGASDNTSRIIEPLLRWLLPHSPPETIGFMHFLIRKLGHLSEYAVLGLLARRAMAITLDPQNPARAGWKAAGFALLIAAAYAATDEFHQSFVPGRTPALGDVLIDTSGACIALIAVELWRKSRPVS
jgi:VanZ family protein